MPTDDTRHTWGEALKRHVGRPLKQGAANWAASATFELGAALAYYGVFAIAPMILLVIAIAGLVFGKEAAQGRVIGQIESTAGHTVAAAINDTLSFAYTSGTGLWATVIGAVVLFSAVTALFGQLQSALDTIWGVRPKSGQGVWGIVKQRFWSFVAVLGVGILLLAAILANGILSALEHSWHEMHLPGSVALWRAGNLVLGWLFVSLAFTLIYQVLPDVEIAWSDVLVGAAVSGLLVMLGNWVISLYLTWSGTTTAYGAAGSVIVLMLWVYYSAQVILFGAEFTQAYARQTGKPIEPYATAERIPSRDAVHAARTNAA